MMSYGGTAQTSFSLVRALVANDKSTLAKVDTVLRNRGFAKLVTENTSSQHTNAHAEAVRELKWLREYLQNAHDRADKLSPNERRRHITVVDDEEEDEPPSGEPRGSATAAAPIDGMPNDRAPLEANSGVASAHKQTSPRSPTATAATSPSAREAYALSAEEHKEYDHTSEESDDFAEDGSVPTAQGTAVAVLPSSVSPDSLQHTAQVSTEGTNEENENVAPGESASKPSTETVATIVSDLAATAPVHAAPTRPPVAEGALPGESRLEKRQRHTLEREQALKRQEELRLEREMQRARAERERRQERQERERRRATTSASASNDEELWCMCRRPAYGFMLACANPKCKYEWYHGDCVGMDKAPKSRWFCSLCRPARSFSAHIPAPRRAAESNAAVVERGQRGQHRQRPTMSVRKGTQGTLPKPAIEAPIKTERRTRNRVRSSELEAIRNNVVIHGRPRRLLRGSKTEDLEPGPRTRSAARKIAKPIR